MQTASLLNIRSVLLCLLSGIAAVALPGCRGGGSAAGSAESPTGAAVLQGNVRTFQIKGVVVSADPAKGEVTINAEAIPGFMEAMAMPYTLAQPNIASELHPGDHIVGRLRVSDTGNDLLDEIVVTAQAKPDYKPSVFYNVPKPGEAVPDFSFLNQSGKIIHIDQFRGKALLVTFIYTRCPLPDFCMRMSRNFATIEHDLAADHQNFQQTHLLSVSFDPGYDTPQVLRRYAEGYVGKDATEAFSHWDFAAPPKPELAKVDEFFDVGVTPGPSNTLAHSLSTVVIGPDGKIVDWYPSNDWSPESVVKDLKAALDHTATERRPAV